MILSRRLLIEAVIIASITTAGLCLFLNMDGYSVTIIEQEAQSKYFQVIDEELLAVTDGHIEMKWVKSPDWHEISTIFFSVFLIFLLVRLGIVWLLSNKLRNHRK